MAAIPVVGAMMGAVLRCDAHRKVAMASPHLRRDDRILDLGAGSGFVTRLLRARGHRVTAVDVRDWAVAAGVRPSIYDGRRLPYAAASFDVVLLLSVLHHVDDAAALLGEAARVGRRVLVIEDVFASAWQRRLTHLADSVANWHFRGHPHGNLSDRQWLARFRDRGWQVSWSAQHRFLLAFRQALYYVDTAGRPSAKERSPLRRLNTKHMAPTDLTQPTLLFVYNGDSSLFARATDYLWKLARPDTYPCSLCKITYDNVGMRRDWKAFVNSLPYRIEFLHRDEFRRAFPEFAELPLPAILRGAGYDLTVLIDAEQLGQLADLDALKQALAGAVMQRASA